MEKNFVDVSLREDGILLITIEGDLSYENLPLLKESIEKANEFIAQKSALTMHPFSTLVDVSAVYPVYAPDVILLLADFEKKNRPYIQKTVVYGASTEIKFAGEVISAFSNRKNISFVKSEEEAIALLKGQ